MRHTLSCPACGSRAPVALFHDFDGRLIVPPGHMIFFAYTIAQTGVFSIGLEWAEVPV